MTTATPAARSAGTVPAPRRHVPKRVVERVEVARARVRPRRSRAWRSPAARGARAASTVLGVIAAVCLLFAGTAGYVAGWSHWQTPVLLVLTLGGITLALSTLTGLRAVSLERDWHAGEIIDQS